MQAGRRSTVNTPRPGKQTRMPEANDTRMSLTRFSIPVEKLFECKYSIFAV